MVGWLGLLFGDSGVRYGCIYVSGRIQAFLVSACFNSCSAHSVSVSEGFLRFDSLRGVVPLVFIRGIVRSLLVYKHVCAGGSVAIGQCYRYIRLL